MPELKESGSPVRQRREPSSPNLMREFWDFLKYSKRWWLLPIVVIMVLLSAFILLTESSAIFPMIYAIF